MPFSPSDLSALTSANGFTLWHYRTLDERAEVLTAGYFAAASSQLLPGDIVIVQASDATAIVPIRGGTNAGDGLTVDNSGIAPALLRSATLAIDVALAANAVVRAIALDPVEGVVLEGAAVGIGATVTGPIAQVTFALRDSAGADAAPPQTVPVGGGRATAAFIMPSPASGYRFSAAEATDPTLFTLSQPFVVAPLPRLLAEAGGRLLLETGGQILL